MITYKLLIYKGKKNDKQWKKTNLQGKTREIGEGKNFQNLNILISQEYGTIIWDQPYSYIW